ncbi:MAG: CPBP family intramembrane metalloprotease [Chitinophagales bacterium]|nr:CPBP family intramembrane metalloprotease [Chitinophagales bacterium]
MDKKGIGYKILHFPLTKIILGIIVVVGLYALSQNLISAVLEPTTLSKETENLIAGIISSMIAIIAYIVLYRYYERREITELSAKKFGSNIFLGLLIGIVLQSLTILFIYIKGGYEIVSINRFIYVIPALTMAFTSAIFEEILLRGIIFRIMEEKLGSYIALIISALIFGGLHFTNPNGSLVASLGLAIQAGILLGASYMYSRSLWLPIALHFAWNFMQSGIYGATVSGHKTDKSWITSQINGAAWYTGGEFGPEGSIQATVFCLIAAIILLYLCHKENKIIAPFWKEKRPTNNV